MAKTVEKALAAADLQSLRLPGQDTAATLITDLAEHCLQLRRRIKDVDDAITAALAEHPQATILMSMPGIGILAAAELTAATGDLSTFTSPDKLAAYAGLAPVPHDSGTRTGQLRRPTRYHRRLRYTMFMSALTTIRNPGPSRDYYQRKRDQGRNHNQALIALARRRVNVLWALLRDDRVFTPTPPNAYASARPVAATAAT